MKIAKNTVIKLAFKIHDMATEGRSIPPQSDEFTFLCGYSQFLPKVEETLMGLEAGSEITNLILKPEDHFGEYNEKLVIKEKRTNLPKEINKNVVLEGKNPVTGMPVLFFVREIDDENVTLDGNHPLAGKTIKFSGKVISVRAATEDEIAHGHAHGDDGHQHHH